MPLTDLPLITKPQILKMLEEGIIQYDLFSDHVCEVENDGVRYILRRNPIRAEQIAMKREEKYGAVVNLSMECNRYLSEHPKASNRRA